MSSLASGIVKKTTSYNADPKSIKRRAGWNPRFDFGEIEELKESIKQNGFYKHKPLVVRRIEDGSLELIDGDRRFTAVEQLLDEGHKFEDGIPIVLEDKNITEVDGLVLMFTANTGKPFLPLEEAAAYKRMVDAGMKLVDIAKRIGKSEGHVKDRISLLSAAPEVKEALAQGEVGSTLAENIVNHAKGDHEKQKELVKKVKEGKKREVKQEVEAPKTKKPAEETQEKRALSQAELMSHELQARTKIDELCAALGIDPSNGLQAFASESDERALAFHAGVALAMQKAQGVDTNLSI